MKKLFTVLLIVLMALTLVGCGQTEEGTASDEKIAINMQAFTM